MKIIDKPLTYQCKSDEQIKHNQGNPTWIVIHYGGKGATSQGNYNSFNDYRPSTKAGAVPGWHVAAHYAVDDKEIWRILPDTDRAAHCGAYDNGTGLCKPTIGATNENSIGIETAADSSGNMSTQTEANVVELTNYLMKTYNIDTNHVVRHYDCSGEQKLCPLSMVPGGLKGGETRWTNFKKKLGGSTGIEEGGYGWEDVTKAIMKWGYDNKKAYGNVVNTVQILGKTLNDIRCDCSGLASAILKWFGLIDSNKNSTTFVTDTSIKNLTKKTFTSLDDCVPGDILAISKEKRGKSSGHVEVYAGDKKVYNWGVDPANANPANNYQSNISNESWEIVWTGLGSQTGSGGSGGTSTNPFDWNLTEEQVSAIVEQNKKIIQSLKTQGLDAVVEDTYLKVDFSARLNDYVRYLNVHKIAGIQMNPNAMLRKNFKQDFIVIVRKKLYYAATMSSDENYLRIYYFNNLIGCSVSHQVNGQGTCSFQIMGGQKVTVINNMQESSNDWVDYEHLLEGLTNIDNEASNITPNYNSFDPTATVEHKWRMGSDNWNSTTANGVDYKDLMKAKQAKYGWRFAEKCDIEPMDEVIVFVKSRYTKNEQGQYKFNKMFVGFIDQVTKKYTASATAPTIDVTCSDQVKLLKQSYVNYHPAFMPGKSNNGFLDISFDTDEFGFFKINEPLAYGIESVSDPVVRETLIQDFLSTNIFYGLHPNDIIISQCLAAGIPKRYLETRLEPVKVVPYLYNMAKSGYDFMTASFKSRYEYISQIAKLCFMEFYFDEEGKAVFKIPTYVIGSNYLTTNNDGNEVSAKQRGFIGQKVNYGVDVSVLTPYCKLVTPMIYSVKEGTTLRQISQEIYGHIDRAVEIQVLNLNMCQKYSTVAKLPQCEILVLKFDDTDIAARKEYRDLIALDLTSSLAQALYNKQSQASNENAQQTEKSVMDALYHTSGRITMSQITDEKIKVIPAEDLISFTLNDSDKDLATCISVTCADFMDVFNGNKMTSLNCTVPSLSMIMRFGVRPASIENTPFVADEKDAQLMGDIKLLQQLAMRYTGSATVVENSDIKVGSPIRFFSYDEQPNADTMMYAASKDIAKTVFYVTRINRTYRQDGVSTMTLDLVAGRTMGQESVFDMSFTLYSTFYNERKDIDMAKANELASQYNPFQGSNSDSSDTANSSTSANMDTTSTNAVEGDFSAPNAGENYNRNKNDTAKEDAIYNYFHNTQKWNKALTCGLLANAWYEHHGYKFDTSGNPDAQNGVLDYGMLEWQGGRATNLKKFAKEKGGTVADLSINCQFVIHELNGAESAAWNKMKDISNTAEGAYQAGYNIAKYYERCATQYQDGRGQLAKFMFTHVFKNTP